jgi:phage-related protein
VDISPAAATIIAAVVTALVSAAMTLIVCIINSKTQHAKYLAELEKQNANYIAEFEKQNSLMMYRLEQLERKVGEHNHFDTRLVAVEQQIKTLFNQRAG